MKSYTPDIAGMVSSPRVIRLLRIAVVLLSVTFVLLYLYIAARRMRYPFDIEQMESGILVSVWRLVHGQTLYAEPSIKYVPFLYAPLYFYICAFFAKWTGVSFFTLRLVSTLSAVGAQAVLFGFVYLETRSWFPSLAAVGLFASLNAFIGAWFDIGRVDSLFTLFFILALFCTRFAPPILAAAAWVLAFQTKQSAIALAVPFLLMYWDPKRKSRVLIALGSYIAMSWLSIQYFNHINGGWYTFYVFGDIRGLGGVVRMAAMYLSEVVLSPLSIAVVLIVAAAIFTRPRLLGRAGIFYAMGSAMLLLGFWWVHFHRGVGNTMQVLYLWIALLFGIALHRLLQFLEAGTEEASSASEAATEWRRMAMVVLLCAVLAQLGSQLYNPGQFIPPATQLHSRESLIAQIRQVDGDVYVINHNFDAMIAGKPAYAEGEAVGLIVDAFPNSWGRRLAEEFRQDSEQHQWKALVVDAPLTRSYTRWTGAGLTAFPVEVPTEQAGLGRYLTSEPIAVLLPCAALSNGAAQRILPPGEAINVTACPGIIPGRGSQQP